MQLYLTIRHDWCVAPQRSRQPAVHRQGRSRSWGQLCLRHQLLLAADLKLSGCQLFALQAADYLQPAPSSQPTSQRRGATWSASLLGSDSFIVMSQMLCL